MPASPARSSLVVLDYDGVLVDSLPPLLLATREFGESRGVDLHLTARRLADLDNVTFDEIGCTAGVPETLLRDYGRHVLAAFESLGSRIRFFPRVGRALEKLAEDHRLAVVSANHSRLIRRVLGFDGYDRWVARVYGGEERRPKSAQIDAAMAELNANRDSTWMIGDTVSDIRHARAAGVGAIAVTWGWQSRTRLKAEKPDFIVDHPSELTRLPLHDGAATPAALAERIRDGRRSG
jgi:phosphoglycolate phosphatase-like HAD superfamily hydrolase